ncbi:MAG: CYTH and CHAD domain-containing protein [Rubrivivax sp.]|nr:CYTH and CHAD domain-containing protein [Rubrivivax sp.]
MIELELKLCVPAGALPSLRAAFLQQGAQRLRLQARYFDTADGLLARHRIALRLRLENGHWLQTLKAAGAGVAHRLEDERPVPGARRSPPALDLHRHHGSPAGLALDSVLRGAPGAHLVERHATDVRRLRCVMACADGTQIEAALDIGQALAGARSSAIAELEFEHLGGPVQGLFDVAAAFVRHGGLWLSTVTKAERGQRLLQDETLPCAFKARAPRLQPGADGPTLLRALLQSALEQVLANASELAQGLDAAETVHQLRVGLRRLRVVLRELAPLARAVPPAWAAVLSDTFARLGKSRDQIAVAAAVRPLLEAAGAPRLQWQATPAADPCTVAREPGFQATLVEMLALAHAEDGSCTPMSPAAARALVAARLTRLRQQVLRDGRRFERLPLASQHRVRKRLKRLRYLADFTAALWPRRNPQPCREALGLAQDALGLHQDVIVAADAFRCDAAAHPDAAFAAGYLQAYQAVTARAARQALCRLAKVPAYWR